MEQIYSRAVSENELQRLKYNSFLGNFCNSNGFRKDQRTKSQSCLTSGTFLPYHQFQGPLLCPTDHVLPLWSSDQVLPLSYLKMMLATRHHGISPAISLCLTQLCLITGLAVVCVSFSEIVKNEQRFSRLWQWKNSLKITGAEAEQHCMLFL